MSSVSKASANSLVNFTTHQRHLDRPTPSGHDQVFTATHAIFKDFSEVDKKYEPLVNDLLAQKDNFTQRELSFVATFIATEHLDYALKVVETINDAFLQTLVLGKIAEKYIDINPKQIERILREMQKPCWTLRADVILKVLRNLALTNLQLAENILYKLDKLFEYDNDLFYKFKCQAAHKIASVNPKSTDALSLMEDLMEIASTVSASIPRNTVGNSKAYRLLDIAKALYQIDKEKSKQVWSQAFKASEQITLPDIQKIIKRCLTRELVRYFPTRVLEITNQKREAMIIASMPEEKIQQIIKFSGKFSTVPNAQSIFLYEEAKKFHSAHPNYPQGAFDLLCHGEKCIDASHDICDKVFIGILKKIAELNLDKAKELIWKLKKALIYYSDEHLFLIWVELCLIYAKANSSNPDRAFSVFDKLNLSQNLDLSYKTYRRIAKRTFQIFRQNIDKIREFAIKTHQVCRTAIILETLDHCPKRLHQYVTDNLIQRLNLETKVGS